MPLRTLDGRENSRCQRIGAGGAPHLVEHHAQLLALAAEAKHGLDKIVPIRRIQPCGAENNRLRAVLQQELLALPLGAAVRRPRTRLVLLGIRHASVARKDIVGADVDDPCARRGQVLDRQRIDEASSRLVLLRLIHIGIGCAIDNQVDSVGTHVRMHRRAIGNVQLRHVREKIGMRRVRAGQVLHAMAQLTI